SRRNRIHWHYVRDDALFSTIKVVSRHQTTQKYGTILLIELTTVEIRNSKAYKEYHGYAMGEAVPKLKASARKKKGDSASSTTPHTPTPTTTVESAPRLSATAKEKQPSRATTPVEHKNQKRSNEMNYPRFTKVIIDYFVTRKPSISRRNRINWHYVRDDAQNSKAYKEYYACAMGEAAPKLKASARKKKGDFASSTTPPTLTPTTTVKSAPRLSATAKGKQPSRAITPTEPTDVQRTEAEQLKIILKWSRQETHISQQRGSGTDEGTGSKPGVPEVPSDDSEEELSWNSSDDEDVGGHISQSPIGIFINQSKYALESLKKYGFKSYDPVDTPMVEKSKLDEDKEGKAVDPSHYRGMIGTLLYLTASRPDLQFAICMCARYQARPTEKHVHAVKRIFRYLRGTVHQGLCEVLQNLPTFDSVFRFEVRLKSLEANFSEYIQTNPFAKAVSNIPGIVHQYMNQQMTEAVRVAVQIQTNQLYDSYQRENNEFPRTINENMKRIIKEQVKSQTILDSYGDTVILKRRREDDDDQEEGPSAGSDRGSKRQREVIPTETPIIVPTIPPSPDYTPASPDYSPAFETESDPSEDLSSDHIPSLPAVSPFLSSDDDTTDSDTPDTPRSPTYGILFTEITASTQRSPVIPCRRVMILAHGQPIPYGRSYRYHFNGPVHMMTTRKKVGLLPV
nr:uncharacterized mitochondrial protein AtMg00810-like [Tanacetum cinerariifolium]